MNKLLYCAALLLAAMPAASAAAQSSVEEMTARGKFLAGHPAVARAYHGGAAPALPVFGLTAPGAPASRPAPRRAAALPQLWANMIGSDSWTGRYTPYGIYSFFPSSSPEFSQLCQGTNESMNANGGGVRIGNRYYSVNWGVGMVGLQVKYYVWDTDTWALVYSDDSASDGIVAQALAYDRVSDVCYGSFFNDALSGYELGTIKYNTRNPIKTRIGDLPLYVVAMGVNSHGELYAICEDGILYSVDTQTAALTKIGDTGVKVAGTKGTGVMSGAIDQHTDTFYWTVNDVYGNSYLATVDVATAQVTKVADMPGHERLQCLQAMAPFAADGAPGYLGTFTADFTAPSLTGTVQMTMPAETYGGTPITEALNYVIAANGQTVATGTAAPGAEAEVAVTVPQGDVLIETWAANAVGNSPTSSLRMYAGYDVPVMNEVKYTARDRESTITWLASSQGVHKGYIGDLTYDITRQPDGTVVAVGVEGNTYTDEIGADAPLANYYYEVTPDNSGVKGEPMASNANVVGSALEPPYYESFDGDNALSAWTVIDVNADGNTWKQGYENYFSDNRLASCEVPYSDYGGVPADDWLLTPPIALKGGTEYKLTFSAMTRSFDPDALTVAVGSGIDPSKYVTVMPASELDYYGLADFEATVTPEADGEQRIGFHRTSAQASGAMLLDDVRLVSTGGADTPAAPSGLKVTADPAGALSATLTFTAPTESKDGTALSALTKAEIYVDDTLAQTVTDIAPGREVAVPLEVDGHGMHKFAVQASNESGSGQTASISEFVGQDIPAPVKPRLLDKADHVELQWERSDAGATGHYVNPEHLRFNVYTWDSQTYDYTPMLENISETSASFELDTDEGAMGKLQLYVVAVGDAGQSNIGASNSLVVGKPYDMPYIDHFTDAGRYTYDAMLDDNFNFSTGSASDGDNASFAWTHYFGDSKSNDLTTLKIDMSTPSSPYLTFDYQLTEGDCIEVYLMLPDGTETKLGEAAKPHTDTELWQTAQFPLAAAAGQRYARIRLHFTAGDQGAFMLVDNLQITDAVAQDLTLSLDGSDTQARYGEHADIMATVTNAGAETCGTYTLRVLADGKELGTATGSGIEFSRRQTHHFTCGITPASPSTVNITAELLYDADMHPENNTASASLNVMPAGVSAPEELIGKEENGATLTWKAPTEFYSEPVEDDFEAYTPWSITGMGDWKLVDGDGGHVITLDMADFPNEGMPQAFTIFNPRSIGVPEANTEANPHSGAQYLACFAAKVNEVEGNDDWLISPILPGTAQTISFYAKQMISDFGAEHLQVLASRKSDHVEDFELVQEYEITNADDWRLIEASLPDGSLYFALRVVTRDGHLCMIDDISYEAGSCRDIDAYRIYRDGLYLAEVPAGTLTYVDAQGSKAHRYNVTAFYANGRESAFSNDALFTGTGAVDALYALPAPADIYTATGVLVRRAATTLKGLDPGVYVAAGRKYIVKE